MIVAFDSLADAQAWYATPEYGAAIKMRQLSANTRLFIVAGEAV